MDIPFDRFHEYLKEQYLAHGDVFRLSLGKKTAVVLGEPEMVRSILKRRPAEFRRISAMQDVFGELGIDGVFSAEGEEWRAQRRMMNQAFKTSQLTFYYPVIQEITKRLLSVLADICTTQSRIDFQALMQRFTIDVTTKLAFGYDVNSLGNSQSELQEKLSVVFPMISYRVKAPVPYWRYVKLSKDKALDNALEYIQVQAREFIAQAESNVADKGDPSNILEAMILARDEEGISFSEDQLYANIVTLLLAGEDTAANTLSWIIHYLTENPHYQEKLYEEILEITPKVDLTDPKSLDEFPLLAAVIQEAMRLMPVAPFLYVENINQEMISDYKIPPGTMIVLLLAQAAHNDTRFNDHEAFKPERWLEIDEETKKQQVKDLMFFGGGPRLCPGMQLSLIEMKYALIAMIQTYQFSKEEEEEEETEANFAFTVMPKNLNVNVSQRE